MTKRSTTPVESTSVKYKVGDPLVVRWVDIHHASDGWLAADDVKASRAEVMSLGFFLMEGDAHLVIGSEIGTDDDESFHRAYIPLGCILDIKRVEWARG